MMKHPHEQIIQDFANGTLIPGVATMVSSHLEVCKVCSDRYQHFIHTEAKIFEDVPYDLSKTDLDDAFTSIMNDVDSKLDSPKLSQTDTPVSIEVSGQVIELPRAMNFLKDQKIPWKEFGKNNAIAPISMGPNGNFYLIYIGPGERVPHHDHTGLEYSYVAAGSYEDGISSFNTGDFSVSGSGDKHSPHATSSDGCLVISWVEGRLNYFNGIFKPLNSLLWWYLHRA